MAEPAQLADLELVEELEHVGRFSRSYFNAFKVHRERMRFWKTMILVLDKEQQHPKGRIKGNFSSEDIEFVSGEAPDDLPRARKEIVERFSDANGEPFLEELEAEREQETPEQATGVGHAKRGRRGLIKVYRLSAAFEAAGAEYARGVITHVFRLPAPHSDIDRLLTERGSRVFRQVLELLSAHYFVPWTEWIAQTDALLKQPHLFEKEYKRHSPYWAMTVAAWKQHLLDPHRHLDADEFYTETRNALRKVDTGEIERCLRLMTSARIVIAKPETDPVRYALNEVCHGPLREYTTKLRTARGKMTVFLSNELRLGKIRRPISQRGRGRR